MLYLSPPVPHHFGVNDPICLVAVNLQDALLGSSIPSPLHCAELLPCIYGVTTIFGIFLLLLEEELKTFEPNSQFSEA